MDYGLIRFIRRGIRFAVAKASTKYVGIRLLIEPITSFYLNLPPALPNAKKLVSINASGDIEYNTLGSDFLETLSPNQTVWTLSEAPSNPELSKMYLNGQKQTFLIDYSINAQIVTWLGFTLSPTDYLEINY